MLKHSSSIQVLGSPAEPEGFSGPSGSEEIRLSVGSRGIGPVARGLVDAGIEVLALVRMHSSLEDLFWS